MEINVQQMEALLHLQEQQSQLPRKTDSQPAGFEDLLNHKIGDDAAPTSPVADPGLAGAALYSQIMLENGSETQPVDADAAVLEAAFAQASGTLDLWDQYARAISGSATGASLRSAYSLLEGIDGQVSQLKQTQAYGRNSMLDGLINELEVLSATEKFKFNRGDYQI